MLARIRITVFAHNRAGSVMGLQSGSSMRMVYALINRPNTEVATARNTTNATALVLVSRDEPLTASSAGWET